MADPTPIASPTTPGQGPPRTFRLRSVMLAIAVIAACLALSRDDPVRGALIALLLGSTAALHAWLIRLAERDKGQRPGPAGGAFFLCLALMT
ncbi:hypothetical protein [Tautonia marina]|uniref:hypothetical protein n=1 Tax=Tautonia marina TaxID=2653855 RepID=UPI001260E8A9|nr:hypothetical protein [Tautonia marina]